MIILTCGHTVTDYDDVIHCSIRGSTRDHRPAVDYVGYCKSCYEDARQAGSVLFDEGEENKWLGSGDTMNIKFPERYKEQHMKTIALVDEQVDDIVIQELKSMYDGLAENLLSRMSNTGHVYMDHDKNKDIAIMRDMLRSISMVLDYMGVQYGE